LAIAGLRLALPLLLSWLASRLWLARLRLTLPDRRSAAETAAIRLYEMQEGRA